MDWADITERTQEQCKQDILTMLDGVGFTATSWQVGSIALGCVEIGGFIWSKLTQVAVAIKEANQLLTAHGAALDAYIKSQYDEARDGATSAQYLIELTCADGEGPHSIDVGDVVATDGEHTYRNIEGNSIAYPYTLAGGTSATFLFEAEVPGSASTVSASSITQLLTTYAGVTITDGALSSSGEDQETEERCKTRCRAKWATLSQGETIQDQVVYICLASDPTITRVGIDDTNPRGDYTFDVYLASDSGAVSPEAVTAAQDALELRFFGSETAEAAACDEDSLDIAAQVYYDPNFEKAAVVSAVEDAIAEWIKTIPIGGFSYGGCLENVVTTDDIRHAIRGATIGGVEVVRTIVLDSPSSNHDVPAFDVVTAGTVNILGIAASS